MNKIAAITISLMSPISSGVCQAQTFEKVNETTLRVYEPVDYTLEYLTRHRQMLEKDIEILQWSIDWNKAKILEFDAKIAEAEKLGVKAAPEEPAK